MVDNQSVLDNGGRFSLPSQLTVYENLNRIMHPQARVRSREYTFLRLPEHPNMILTVNDNLKAQTDVARFNPYLAI